MGTKYQPGLRVSEYLLEECIGSGAFAEVWRARHHVWDAERVAIKLPTEPEYVRFLRREGVVVHGLRHPNVVRVLGLDPYADTPYLIMELVNGPSLGEIIRAHPKGLRIATALTILRGVLSGLEAAHAANVLHRDIKPGNILLDLDGKPCDEITVDRVKLADFGLGAGNADALRSIAQSVSMHREEALVGTLAYMAPELRDGQRSADPRTDLYSVGVVLFELLTGDRPAGAELPGSLRAEVPSAVDEIFRRLYARYDRRYENAAAVLADLERYEKDGRAEAGAAGGPPPVPARPVPPPVPRVAGACPTCRNPVQPFDQFCIQCGAQLVASVRRCAHCGGFPGPHDRFCIFCGASLPDVA